MSALNMTRDYKSAIYGVFTQHRLANNTESLISITCGFNALHELLFGVFKAYKEQHGDNELLKFHTAFIKEQYELVDHVVDELGKWSMQQFAAYMFRENHRMAQQKDGHNG